MKAILKRNIGFSRQKGCPFPDITLNKGDVIEVTKFYTEKHVAWESWCIRILYNRMRYWCVYSCRELIPELCPIIFLEN